MRHLYFFTPTPDSPALMPLLCSGVRRRGVKIYAHVTNGNWDMVYNTEDNELLVKETDKVLTAHLFKDIPIPDDVKGDYNDIIALHADAVSAQANIRIPEWLNADNKIPEYLDSDNTIPKEAP